MSKRHVKRFHNSPSVYLTFIRFVQKLVRSIPVGLNVKHEIAVNAYNTDMFILLFFKQIARIFFFVYSSVSILPRNSFISKIEAIEYNVCNVYEVIQYDVCHVCGGGTGGGSKFLSLNFNTSFQFVFHKNEKKNKHFFIAV